MKIVVQRVSQAQVKVGSKIVGTIGKGLLLLVGIADKDTPQDVENMAKKIVNLRIFADSENQMNLSVKDVHQEILAVPQFTLFGEVKGQNRPFFGSAAKPKKARELFNYFLKQLKQPGVHRIDSGEFGAYMQVELLNDGPVTVVLDSSEI